MFVPDWPAGHDPVLNCHWLSGAGATHCGAQVLAICVQLPQEPVPEHTKFRCSVIDPSCPEGQLTGRVCGAGHGEQVFCTSTHVPVYRAGSHAS